MAESSEPFALLFLEELLQAAAEKESLLLPLTLTYLLSEHIHFLFFLPEEKAQFVDNVFDEVLKGLPPKGKGISYLHDAGFPLPQNLRAAKLIVTTSPEIVSQASIANRPCVSLLRKPDVPFKAQLQQASELQDDELLTKLKGYLQLINVLSQGILSSGHFSLSW